MAHSERFELPTLGIEIRCSIQLSYECVAGHHTDRRHGTLEARVASSLTYPPVMAGLVPAIHALLVAAL